MLQEVGAATSIATVRLPCCRFDCTQHPRPSVPGTPVALRAVYALECCPTARSDVLRGLRSPHRVGLFPSLERALPPTSHAPPAALAGPNVHAECSCTHAPIYDPHDHMRSAHSSCSEERGCAWREDQARAQSAESFLTVGADQSRLTMAPSLAMRTDSTLHAFSSPSLHASWVTARVAGSWLGKNLGLRPDLPFSGVGSFAARRSLCRALMRSLVLT